MISVYGSNNEKTNEESLKFIVVITINLDVKLKYMYTI